jgi:Sap, sulfolipid-1-addressing protein
MWGMVLMFALCCAVEPTRIGVAALLIALPRPFLNLIAFWIGLFLSGGGILLAGMFLLNEYVAPIMEAIRAATSSPAVPPIKIALGVLAISTAAMIVVRSRTQSAISAPVGVAAPVAVPVGGPTGTELQPTTSSIFSAGALWRGTWIGPAVRRGSVPMALIGGLATSAPPIEFCGVILTILASGAAATTQLSAVFIFMLVGYAIAEIPLVCYLVAPVKTRAAVMQVNGWLCAHRHHISLAFFNVFGVLMIAGGVGAF